MAEMQRIMPSHHQETQELSLAVYRGQEGLGAIRGFWSELAGALSSKRFFHLYPWYSSYIESIEADPSSVSFYVFFRGRSPVALFPLKRTTHELCRLPWRCLEIPNHPHMNLSDFIFEKSGDNAHLLHRLVEHLRHAPDADWDLIYIPNALEDSAAAFALKNAPPPWRASALRRKSNYLDCNMPYEAISQNMDGHFRRNLGRLMRRAQGMGALRFHSHRTAEDIRRHFPRFLEVEASGWKGQGGTGTAIVCDPRIVRFYEKLVEDYSEAGRCWLNLLTLGDKCIAGQLCLVEDGTLYLLKIGYDEAYSAIAPGNLILDYLVRDCAADERIHTLSFITERDWNYAWGAQSMAVYDHYIFNRSAFGGWCSYFCSRLKALLRTAGLLRTGETAA